MDQQDLVDMVATLKYKPGWRVRLQPPGPGIWWPVPGTRWYLEIMFPAADSTSLEPMPFPLRHEFPVPAECDSWERWLLDRILDAEHHEIMEFFEVNGRRPFYPEHGRSAATLHTDLYEIRERS